MERARRDRRIEDCPDRWNDIEVRARLRILRRQRGRFRPACHGQAQHNSGDSILDTQAVVPRQVSRLGWESPGSLLSVPWFSPPALASWTENRRFPLTRPPKTGDNAGRTQ